MKKQNISFIYFDVGGVLLDWREGHKRVAKKYGVPYESIREIFDANWKEACRGTLPNDTYMAMFARVLGMKEPLPDVTDFWTDYFTVISQTHTLVRELSTTYRLGIFSNAESGAMGHALKKGLIPSVEWHALVDSSRHGFIKPEARLYEIAEHMSGVPPEEIFFIDDVPQHINVAISRGWQGMVFDTENPEGSIRKIQKILAGTGMKHTRTRTTAKHT